MINGFMLAAAAIGAEPPQTVLLVLPLTPKTLAAKAEPARPAHISDDIQAGGTCLPAELVADARIIALGAYEGEVTTRYSVPGSTSEMTAIAVTAARKGVPVVLVVSAYDPVIWDFAGFPASRLRGVVAYGYSHQAAANLPKRVPVRFGTGRGASACGEAMYAYKGGKDLERLVEQVRQVLGKPVDEFQGSYAPSGFNVDGGPLAMPSRTFATASVRAPVTLDVDSVAPKKEGLIQLIAEGALRRATERDVAAWNAAATRFSPAGHLAPVRSDYLSARNAYVVLRPTTLPRGMYGGHSTNFIVPAGVAAPTDPGSHNGFYFVEDGTCRGSGC